MYRKDQDQKRRLADKWFGGLAWHDKHKRATDLLDATEHRKLEAWKQKPDNDAGSIMSAVNVVEEVEHVRCRRGAAPGRE